MKKYLLLLLLIFIPSAEADDHGEHGGMNGMNGMDGRDGRNGNYFNDSQLTRALAIGAAMTSIPASAHVDDEHGHTSIGGAVGSYSGETGVAVGITHMQKQMSYKGSVGISGSEVLYGVGAGFTW